MFVDGGQRGEHERRLFREHGQGEARDSSQVNLYGGAVELGKKPEGQQDEKCDFELGQCGDPVDDFCMYGVHREECRSQPGNAAITEEAAASSKDHHDHGGIQGDVEEVKAERDVAKDLPQEEVGESHQRAVVIGETGGADEGPHCGAEDLREVVPALHVGVLQDLLLVIVNEAVEEGVAVGQERQKYEDGDEDLVGW